MEYLIFYIMKKVIFLFVLAFGLMSFTSNSEAEKNLNAENLTKIEVVESSSTFDYYRRVCTYRNGVRISCTPWELVIELDEVVIIAN